MSILFEIVDDVAYVTIDRADRMNAVDQDTEELLENIWQKIEVDRTIRCVVFSGAGDRAFSAGADMKSGSAKSGLEYWASVSKNGFGGIAMRQSLTIPVIAKVNGLALGGGMEMVLGCDIVIACDEAKFGLPEAKVGRLPLDGGMVMLQRLIPQKIAAGLMMSGRMMSAQDAADYGLVNAVVPREKLDDEVNGWVNDIKGCAPLSVRSIKATINKTAHLNIHEARGLKLEETIAALESEDANEGVQAFREKRAPKWQGK